MKSSRIFWIWWLSISKSSHGFWSTNISVRRHTVYRQPLRLHASRIFFHSGSSSHKDTVTLVQDAVETLAKRGKTWRRLKHLVELASDNPWTRGNNQKVIVDVGTDHGILPIAWAASGKFRKAIGVDASKLVLEKGANALLQEVLEYTKNNSTSHADDSTTNGNALPVDFRCGDGLACIGDNEADIVCIAGMGVNTMLQILEPSQVERVGCQLILLQPTNSKPRNLVKLYDELQISGWQLYDERIEKLSSRWYLSAAFARGDSSEQTLALPGTKLRELEASNAMRATFEEYVQHHRAWLKADKDAASGLHDEEVRWLDAFGSESN
jgi:tRNA A22 N-methylase